MKRAFTLIELLIVVAIIGILAAIAVPNFLNAQTRAKVSRVYADQRSIATAVESYAVDHGRPPIDMDAGATFLALWPEAMGGRDAFYNTLTTPIAYMTAIPRDPFIIRIDGGGQTGGGVIGDTGLAYHFSSLYDWGKGGPAWQDGYRWVVRSVGPAQRFLPGVYPPLGRDTVYESSNGLKSYGWIFISNKGVGRGE